MIKIGNKWDEILEDEFKKLYYIELVQKLDSEYDKYTIYPPKDDIFNALKCTSYEDVKVVILGQDPYHGKNQAHGLAFSVNENIKIPPSLLNIYKELHKELNLFIPNNGHLINWAKQGVLLLNTSLTVREGEANSHKNIGWEVFTDNIIKYLNEKNEKIIFILWGNNAKSKKKYIDNNKHYILESVHPSPLSANRGFFGCNHFIQINEILNLNNEKTIDWQIKNI